jgi:hypothetical protein
MPTTYTPIASTTVTSTTSSVVFSSIPSTYTDLIIISDLRAATNASLSIQFNSDTGTNYSYTVLDAEGTALQANRQTNTSAIQVASWSIGLGSTTIPTTAITHINSYSNTTTNKPVISRSGAINASDTVSVDIFVGTWRNTAAISTVTLNANTITVGSVFTIYGIKAA